MAIPVTAALLILPAIFGLLAPTSLADNHLLSGESLSPGQSLNQGGYVLAMQNDCNLVLYDNQNPVWATNTEGQGKRCRLNMQQDGNLVILDGSNNDRLIWASNTAQGNGNYILVVQHDRNVVIYADPIFATGTNIRSKDVTVVPRASLTAGHVLNENGEVINRKIAMVVNK